jgi:hypothetical protein
MAALPVSSKRLPGMTQRNVLPIASVPSGDTAAYRTAARGDVPGSRLLATRRATMLQSGSPPGLGHATPCSYENEILDKKQVGPICVRMNSYQRRVWVRLPKKTDPTSAPTRRKPKP